MPGLDPVVFLSPSSIGTAIEVTVTSLASPTELNSISASQGDLVITRTVAAGTDDCVVYYADTTSDAQSLPYIVTSATSGVKFVAIAGRYRNGNIATNALTASRLLRTDASKNLESNAVLTNTRVLYADSNGWPTDSAELTFSGTLLTLGTSSSLTLSKTTGTNLTISSTATNAIACSGGATFANAVSISYNSANLTVGNGVGAVGIAFSGAAGQTRDIFFQSAGSNRWIFRASATAESGSDAGSDFQLLARTDAGASIDMAYTITRAAGGAMTINRPVSGASSIRSTSATAGVGYATGAGGTVAQGSGSGKATGVTLNTVCGTITMDGANLNADTTVAFTFTNSAIAATDLVVIQHSSVGTLGAYNFAVTPAGGSATVSVRNVTPGNLAEAIVLRFAIIKAVTS